MDPKPEQLLLQEMQVLLAEKRTYYSLFRTGLTIVTVPPSVLLFLIATAKYNNIFNHWWVGAVVVAGLSAASLSGIGVINQARRKLRKIERMMRGIENENPRVAEIMV